MHGGFIFDVLIFQTLETDLKRFDSATSVAKVRQKKAMQTQEHFRIQR